MRSNHPRSTRLFTGDSYGPGARLGPPSSSAFSSTTAAASASSAVAAAEFEAWRAAALALRVSFIVRARGRGSRSGRRGR